MYKQIIIARKDLHMSPGKLAAQVSHASMAFLTCAIRQNVKEKLDCSFAPTWVHARLLMPLDCEMTEALYRRKDLNDWAREARERGEDVFYYEPVNADDPYGELRLCEKKSHAESTLSFDWDLYNGWINGAFTKVILQARNKKQLEKAITLSNEIGLKEGKDFFLIRDNCLTELEPEDEDGRTLTCIGFAPMKNEIIDQVGKKFHIWEG